MVGWDALVVALEHSILLGMGQPLDEPDVSGCSSHGIGTFFADRAEHVDRVGSARVVVVVVGAVAVVVVVVEQVRFEVGFETVQIVVVVVVAVVVDVVAAAVVVVAVVVSGVEVEVHGIQRTTVVAVVVSVVLVVVAAVAVVAAEGGPDAHDVAALAAVALFVAVVVAAAVEHLGTVEHVVGTVELVEPAFFVGQNELGIHDVGSFFRTRKPGSALRVR